ncbi:MAG: DNA repair protein RecN [Micrococcales bacterium]
MIEEIIIRDLGVIGEARLQLGPGFNVLSGETGAGKTMILTALGLLLGERADSSSVRKGQPQAQVHGLWRLDGSEVGSTVADRLNEAGLDFDLSELIVSRTVASDGKSRASISAQPVPAGLLAELGQKLVVVHGQSEQLRLRSATAQREALDAYAGPQLATQLAEYQTEYQNWKAAEERLAELVANAATRMREADEMRAAVKELEAADPQPGEDVELAALAERLTNLEAIRFAVASAHEAISSEEGNPDALGLLSQARKQLEGGAGHDSRLEALAERAAELGAQARDLSGELASLLSQLENDSERSLDEIQGRRAVLNTLMRRYGPSLDEVIAYRESASLRLLDLDTSEDQINELRESLAAMHEAAKTRAATVSALRQEAAGRLAEAVTQELHELAMPGATLVVDVTPAELGPHGADSIAIQLSSYPGADPRPLGKGASGGELSRIMLAIEVVLADTKSNPTFIFDEVDAGVGGAAAIEIGKRLARLAKTAQVIVVTHLAQVAAFANNHLRVLKSHNGEFTSSDVVALAEVSRVEELARMLSGLTESELGLAHAAELWQLAKRDNL